jgi:hypothetical protein
LSDDQSLSQPSFVEMNAVEFPFVVSQSGNTDCRVINRPIYRLILEMDSYIKFAGVAALTMLIGVPLWGIVLAPEEVGFAMFLDPGFWFLFVLWMVYALGVFWVGQKSDW